MKTAFYKYIFSIFALFLIASCSERTADKPVSDDYVNADLLINATDLLSAMESGSELIIIDTRTSFEAFSEAHIPGAIYFHSRRDLNDPDVGIDSYLVAGEVFEEKMRALGINNDSRVVLYDEGNSLGAARLFYALEYYGFNGYASLLNGGFAAWIQADLPVDSALVNGIDISTSIGNFTALIREERQCDIAYVTGIEPGSNKIIFDVRSRDEFEGTDVRAARGGHIPGAVNLEWSEVLEDGDVNFFKSHTKIQALYDSLGVTRDKEIIPHCHTNVRGSHAYFTLRLMGYDSVKPFEGSWAEYGNATDVPVQ